LGGKRGAVGVRCPSGKERFKKLLKGTGITEPPEHTCTTSSKRFGAGVRAQKKNSIIKDAGGEGRQEVFLGRTLSSAGIKRISGRQGTGIMKKGTAPLGGGEPEH